MARALCENLPMNWRLVLGSQYRALVHRQVQVAADGVGLPWRGSARHTRSSHTRKWRNGRRAGFRCQCPQGRGGSNPPLRTTLVMSQVIANP